jgi:threonine/homoserine/homoserine lactone efflux protein
LIVTVSPGPANIAVSTVALRHGRRRGLWFGLGLTLGLAFWGLVAATGMGAVLQASAEALFALKILGGVYLSWLAFNAAKAALKGVAEEAGGRSADHSWGLPQGLLLNLSNPKAVFAWMAALSMGLSAEAGGALVPVATALCMLIGLANYAGYALIFSLPGMMAGYRRISRWVEGAVAGLFSAAALGLFRSALGER